MPELPGEAVDPDEAQRGANRDGNNADQDAGLAHALEQFQRRQAPNDITHFVLAQQAFFAQKNQAEDA